jgi:nucleotide-binding universal stress UspA family protein
MIRIPTVTIREIVFPVDFSERSVDVCPYVTAITQRFGAKLTLLHVIESLPLGSSPLDRLYTGDEAEINKRRELANQALEGFRKHHIAHVPASTYALTGDPANAIVAYGGEADDRMIVMPTRGYGAFRQMLLGSVTAKVLHDSKCPVLTGPHIDKAVVAVEWLALRRMLCTVSLDWETDQVLKACAQFAKQLDAELIAIHVVTPVEEGLLPLMEPGGPPLSTESVTREVQEALDRNGVSAQVYVSVGEVSREVSRAAKAHKADLVAIGKGGAPELPGRLGSHGYAIVRRSPCPVLCL